MTQKWVRFVCALAWMAVYLWFQPAMARGQGAAPEEIRKAQSLFQAKDYDGAIKTLEDYYQRNSTANMGWLLLGAAYRQKGDLDKALAANLKALQIRPLRLQGSFNAAGLYALKGNAEEAFKLLQQLRDTGAFDLDLVKNSADLKSLRADPRFEKLFPKPEDFANPFKPAQALQRIPTLPVEKRPRTGSIMIGLRSLNDFPPWPRRRSMRSSSPRLVCANTRSIPSRSTCGRRAMR